MKVEAETAYRTKKIGKITLAISIVGGIASIGIWRSEVDVISITMLIAAGISMIMISCPFLFGHTQPPPTQKNLNFPYYNKMGADS